MQMHNYNNNSKWDSGATGWDALDLGSRNRKVCGGSSPFYPTTTVLTKDIKICQGYEFPLL